MTQADAVYAKFETLEEELAHCYFLLHERFITNPPLARFWAETAMDEFQHSSILRYCREHKLFANEIDNQEIVFHIDDLLESVKSIVENPNVAVEDAFYAALLMESSELDDAYSTLTAPLSRNHPMLYQAVQASLRSHHGRFADGAAEFIKDKAYAEAFNALGREGRAALWGRFFS